MELSDLSIFRAVVEAGGVTRAAHKLHRVQSSVTTRVRQLEQKLGVELFVREGKRLRLSPSGTILFEYAERMLELAREAREAVHDRTPRGLLRLGAMESTAAVRLPVPLREYHLRFPQVTLELHTGNPQQLTAALIASELDAALMPEPVRDNRFDKVPLYDEELVLVSPLDQSPIRSPGDARSRTILAFEPGCPHRKRLEDWLAGDGQLPHRIVEMSSYHALLGCVVAGMGIALLPRSVLNAFPDRKLLGIHALPKAQNSTRIVLIWRKGVRSAKISALCETLQSAAAGHPPRRKKKRTAA